VSESFSLQRRKVTRDLALNRSLLLAGMALVSVPLVACNTVEGAGKDIKVIGHPVEHTANEAGHEMGDAVDELDDEAGD
jgi:predicted small secreted protein